MSAPAIDATGCSYYGAPRRAGTCANPIVPEQRAHDELANSTQLPPRPDLELNMKSSLEFELGGFESASDGSYEPKDPPAECDRRAPDLSLLRWLEGHGPEPDCHSNHSLCPATVHLALARYWLSPIALTLRPQSPHCVKAATASHPCELHGRGMVRCDDGP